MDNSHEKQNIVIDGAHFFNKSGTGIASYARSLASTLRRSQCSLSVLYGRKVGNHKHLSELAIPTQLFGEAPVQRPLESLVESVWLRTRARLQAKPAGTAVKIATRGIDLRAFDPPLPLADTILNADRLYVRATHAFAAKQRLTEVALPEQIALAHWTSPLPVKVKGAPNVYTLHDLIPLQYPYFVYDKDGRAADLHAAIARDADLIITVSEASKQVILDLLRLPSERVHVTYQPAPQLPSIPREEAERLVQNIYGARPGDYALFVGATEPKKNLKRLIEAFLLSGVKIPLLIAGPRGWLDSGRAWIDQFNRARCDHVCQTGLAGCCRRGGSKGLGPRSAFGISPAMACDSAFAVRAFFCVSLDLRRFRLTGFGGHAARRAGTHVEHQLTSGGCGRSGGARRSSRRGRYDKRNSYPFARQRLVRRAGPTRSRAGKEVQQRDLSREARRRLQESGNYDPRQHSPRRERQQPLDARFTVRSCRWHCAGNSILARVSALR